MHHQNPARVQARSLDITRSGYVETHAFRLIAQLKSVSFTSMTMGDLLITP
jgi:hypothetical protein